MRHITKILSLLLIAATKLVGQNTETERLIDGEFKMTFPSIYFKHKSIEYSSMPYSVDSCFKFIAANIKNLNSYPIWRDSSETEQLTNERARKLKNDLNRFIPSEKINIQSMGKRQKISRRTIQKAGDSLQIQYLLTLNSVLDLSGVVRPKIQARKKDHRTQNFLWCPYCWRHPTKGVPWRIFPKKVKPELRGRRDK